MIQYVQSMTILTFSVVQCFHDWQFVLFVVAIDPRHTLISDEKSVQTCQFHHPPTASSIARVAIEHTQREEWPRVRTPNFSISHFPFLISYFLVPGFTTTRNRGGRQGSRETRVRKAALMQMYGTSDCVSVGDFTFVQKCFHELSVYYCSLGIFLEVRRDVPARFLFSLAVKARWS